MGNNDDNNKEKNLKHIKTSDIRDSDDFQDQFEMISEEVELTDNTDEKELWITRIKVLIISAVFASIANWINTIRRGVEPITPIQALPAFVLMFTVVVLGCLIDDVLRKTIKLKLPSILYISLIAVFFSVPNLLPWGEYFVQELNKVGLLPLCTPILAYAGISLAKDLPEFRKQGIGIVFTAIMCFIGTYLGSVIIAEIVLKLQGVI